MLEYILRICLLKDIPQSVHIHCRHTISAHLFFRDFSFPSLFSYSPRLSLSLSLSLSLALSLSLSISAFPVKFEALLPKECSFYLWRRPNVIQSSLDIDPNDTGKDLRRALWLISMKVFLSNLDYFYNICITKLSPHSSPCIYNSRPI